MYGKVLCAAFVFLLLNKATRMIVLRAILLLVRIYMMLFDIMTFPIYYIFQKSFKDTRREALGKVVKISHTNETVSFTRKNGSSKLYEEIIVKGKVDTIPKALKYAVDKHQDKNCLGTRTILGRENENNADGKIMEKLILGDYEWMSYKEVKNSALNFGASLRFHLEQQPKSLITIFAETRAEWMIACFGSYTQNIGVGTVYINLGDEGVIHAINETKTSVVITSQNLLTRVQKLLPKLPNVRHIVYFEDQLMSPPSNIKDDRNTDSQENVEFHSFKSLLNKGSQIIGQSLANKQNEPITVEAEPEDTAIVMYTSGSTGTPKGVVLTHKNLISTLKALMFLFVPNEGDSYISYLPLAHVFELLSTCTWILFGIKVGYSSPFTMTNMSTKVKKGCQGDASLIKPTIFIAVPLILDRIYKNITDMVKSKGPAFERVFGLCFQYKRYWYNKGRDTPIMNRLLFNKIRALLGGRVNWICGAGAPVSSETQEFIRVCFGAHFGQGYGLTESTAGQFLQALYDPLTECCGKPMTGAEGRLVNWEEGNYKVTDQPNPRGEIILGGDSIAKGYLGKDGEILDGMDGAPVFLEEGGKRWFRTGDIGEYDNEGNLKIIDRKKDLVKLQHGEYVSLGKVETIMKTHSAVDNVCVFGDSYRTFTVALIVASKTYLDKVAKTLGVTMDHEQLINDINVKLHTMKELISHGIQSGLEKFEIPKDIALVNEDWTPESGLITASFKVKRKQIQNHYQDVIDRMYLEGLQK